MKTMIKKAAIWMMMSGLAAAQIQHQKTDPTPLVQAALNAKADATAVNDALAAKSDAMQLASGVLQPVFGNTAINGNFFHEDGKAYWSKDSVRALFAEAAYQAELYQYAGNLQGIANFFGRPNAVFYYAAEQTKLAGIAAGATANSPDATLLARANHTGTQAVSTITGLGTAATAAAGDFATAAQGGLAATAVQPAGLTKAAVGLANVDNTSDVNKPISTAQAAGIATKAGTQVIEIFDTPGTFTWTKLAGAKRVSGYTIGSGGGGGSGRKGATATVRCGGGSGGQGGMTRFDISAAFLSATEAITVGGTTTGGASQTLASTNGGAGTTGGFSSFGNHAFGRGGGGANGGSATDGNGGSGGQGEIGGSNGVNTSPSGGAGGTPAIAITTQGGGCGSGGGITAANVANVGGAGGALSAIWSSATVGAGGAVNTAGSQPALTRASGDWRPGPGGGGGGASTTGNAGPGAAGKYYGQGGGGGGAATDGVGDSGAGGPGAKGAVIVITEF